MSAPIKRHWPSAGFFAILSSYTLLVALVVWGWQKPVLDDAFEILNQRELYDGARFSQEEAMLLEHVWERHPGFGRALLGKGLVKFLEPTEPGGWLRRTSAHIAVRSETEQMTQFALEARGAPGDFPIKVRIFGKGLERRVELSSDQPQPIEWSPNDLKQPAILDVEVSARHSRSAAAPSWAVRLVSSSAGPAREAP